MPLIRMKRSSETGARLTDSFGGVRTSEAMIQPSEHDVSAERKMTGNEQKSCRNNPTIGPIAIAVLFVRP